MIIPAVSESEAWHKTHANDQGRRASCMLRIMWNLSASVHHRRHQINSEMIGTIHWQDSQLGELPLNATVSTCCSLLAQEVRVVLGIVPSRDPSGKGRLLGPASDAFVSLQPWTTDWGRWEQSESISSGSTLDRSPFLDSIRSKFTDRRKSEHTREPLLTRPAENARGAHCGAHAQAQTASIWKIFPTAARDPCSAFQSLVWLHQ